MSIVLATHGLRKTFRGVVAVDDVSLEIHEGQSYGFLGKNGAGKSTFIQMLCGILTPDRGSMEILGKKGARALPSWRASIGYVAQDPRFDGWMTPQELGQFVSPFFPTYDAQHYQSLLQFLDVPKTKRIESLSGGTRTKLALAVALAHRPRLLMLDEPTAGLDPIARRDFHALLRDASQREGHTTFFSSHYVDDVLRSADRVGILRDGKLTYDGAVGVLVDEIRVVAYADVEMVPMVMRLSHAEDGIFVRAPVEQWRQFTGSSRTVTPEDAMIALLQERA